MDTTSGAPYRVPWTPRDVGIGILLFIAAFVIIPIPFVVPFAFGDTESRPALITATVAGVAVYTALIAIIYRMTVAKYGGNLLTHLGIRRPQWSTLGWAAIAFIGALAVGAAYSGIIGLFDLGALRQGCDDQIPQSIRGDAVVLAITSVVVVLVAPPVEEAFLRGFVFPGLLRPWGVVAAVVISGSVFGAAHLLGNPLLYKSLIPFALIGMIFALAYWKSGNLLSSILAHFVFNLMGVIAIAATTCDTTAAATVFRPWGFAP